MKPANSSVLRGPGGSLTNVRRGEVRQPYVEIPAPAPGDQNEWARLSDFLHLLSRRKGVLLGAMALGLIGGGAVTHWTTPTYRASASLEVQGLNEDFLDLHRIDPSARAATFSADTYIQTQADILQDDAVLGRAIKRLHLPKPKPSWKESAIFVNLARKFPFLAPGPAERLRPIDVFRSKLAVTPSPHSRIVRITYESQDPKFAADAVNTLAEEFINYNLEARLNAANQIGKWLGPQLDEMKRLLEHSEAELSASSKAAGLLLTSGTETVAEAKLRQLQGELGNAQADRIVKESAYRIVAQSRPDSLPAMFETSNLKENRTKLTDLRRQRAELDLLYTPNSYRVGRLQAQIDEIEAALKNEMRAIPARTHVEYETALERELTLAKVYQAQAAAVSYQAHERIRYESLKRAVEDNRQIYHSTLQKVKEAGIASAIKPSSVRMIGAASIPSKPYRPNSGLNLVFGLTAGLCAGLAAASGLERSKRVVRAPGELKAWINAPELGAIPSATPRSLHSPPRRPLIDTRPPARLELVTWEQKHSAVSESFHEVLASLVYSDSVKSILVSSASPMEGKTTVVSNLAIALAEIGKSVLLIDGDMRKPRLHEIFGQPNTWGLSDVLSGKNSIGRLPVTALTGKTTIPRLSLLPSGPVTEQITTLLYSPRMQELMSRFRQSFDYLVLDAPPVLRFSDARILGRAADAVLLVARAGRTSPGTVREAAARFQTIGIPVLGTILNDCHQAALDAYGYQYRS